MVQVDTAGPDRGFMEREQQPLLVAPGEKAWL